MAALFFGTVPNFFGKGRKLTIGTTWRKKQNHKTGNNLRQTSGHSPEPDKQQEWFSHGGFLLSMSLYLTSSGVLLFSESFPSFKPHLLHSTTASSHTGPRPRHTAWRAEGGCGRKRRSTQVSDSSVSLQLNDGLIDAGELIKCSPLNLAASVHALPLWYPALSFKTETSQAQQRGERAAATIASTKPKWLPASLCDVIGLLIVSGWFLSRVWRSGSKQGV